MGNHGGMNTFTIRPGDLLIATTATGADVPMRAVRSPEQGRDFPVVWLATEEEFRRSQEAGDDADAMPWPLDAVRATD